MKGYKFWFYWNSTYRIAYIYIYIYIFSEAASVCQFVLRIMLIWGFLIFFNFIFLCTNLDYSVVCGLFVECAKNKFQYLSCIFSMEMMPAWSNVPIYISFLSSLFLKIVRFLQHLCAYWSLIAQGPKQLSFLVLHSCHYFYKNSYRWLYIIISVKR